jgi:regulator of nucleoside diphosphate kinase
VNGKNAVITEADRDRLGGQILSRPGRAAYGAPAVALEVELRRGVVVAPSSIPGNVVTMNTRVRIRDLRSSKPETYTLVFPQHADINEDRMSVLSPLGMALLGAKVGDEVEVEAPAGVRRIRVERILYQPEAAGDFDR